MRVFNKANQAIGERAWRSPPVVACAVQLIDPDSPDFTPVMRSGSPTNTCRWASKRPNTRSLVGQNLMWAIGEVLGDAVTPEIAAAWDEVYWLFALQLVAEEAKALCHRRHRSGAPWRRYRVTDRVDETAETFSGSRPSRGRCRPTGPVSMSRSLWTCLAASASRVSTPSPASLAASHSG